jgi:ABC-type phosphate transport system permease subunit
VGKKTHDLGFRVSTGVFGLMVVLLVLGIGFELTRQSMLSIQKFGFNFWRTEVWDPVVGDFGALHALFFDPRAASGRADCARHRHLHL